MENLPRDLEEPVAAAAAPQTPKRSKRWTFLLVADSGKIISIPWVKPLALLCVIALSVAVVAAATFYVLYEREVRTGNRFRQALSGAKSEIAELRDENEILLARAVIAENLIQKGNPGSKASGETAPAPAEPVPPAIEKETPPPQPKAPAAAPAAVVVSDTIAVDDPSMDYLADQKQLVVQIRIANRGEESQPVSGFVFVRLMPGEGGTVKPLNIPSVRSTQQMSAEYSRGQYFSIARFVQMSFKTAFSGDPDQFRKLTVFIFSRTGEKILEKNFSLGTGGA